MYTLCHITCKITSTPNVHVGHPTYTLIYLYIQPTTMYKSQTMK